MATPKKTKSGKWHVRVYSHTDSLGKRIYQSITADTRIECEQQALKFREDKNRTAEAKKPLTVGEIVDMYIDLSEQTLAATTIHCYRRMRRMAFPDLWDFPSDEMTDIVAQRAINTECKRTNRYGQLIRPKTIKEEWGLVSAAMRKFCQKSFKVVLPKQARDIQEYPKPETVIGLLIGTNIELPCMLSIWLSFSMSEIRGIRYSSIRDGYIYIERVRVDMSGNTIEKDVAKVDTRIRKCSIPEYIWNLILADEGYKQYLTDGIDDYLIKLSAHQLYMRFKRRMAKGGIGITFHGLRHLNASVMLLLNIPEKYAMERGGWRSNHTMKAVYQHTFSPERVKVDESIDDYFKGILKIHNA